MDREDRRSSGASLADSLCGLGCESALQGGDSATGDSSGSNSGSKLSLGFGCRTDLGNVCTGGSDTSSNGATNRFTCATFLFGSKTSILWKRSRFSSEMHSNFHYD